MADEVTKDDRDVVIFYEGKYYHIPFEEWTLARQLGQGERTVLVPLVESGVIVAHVDEDSPKFGTWTNLLNMDAMVKTHRDPE
jgi:hypothetical protein